MPPGIGSVAASPARRPSMPPLGPGYREARVRTARADAGALEVERRLRDRPAVALAADQIGGVTDRVVEEHLVEHGLAGHLAQRADRDAGLVEREREPRDAAVLRHREVGAREQHAVVGLHRHAAPHLLTVDDEAVAIAFGARRQAREIGARAGLAEQLAPVDLSLEDRRHVPRDLVFGAVGEDRRRGHEQPESARRSQRAVLREGRAHDVAGRAVQPAATLFGGEVRRSPSGLPDDAPPVVDRELGIPVLLEPGSDLGPQLVDGLARRRSDRVPFPAARARCRA